MHLQDHCTPLAGTEFLRAELASHRLAEHLGGGAGHRPQARLEETLEHLLQWDLVLLSDEQQLLGGKRMQVQPRRRLLQRRQQGLVVTQAGALQLSCGVQPPLDAELGGPGLGRPLGPGLQGVKAVPEGALLAGIPAEGTKAAVLQAVVGEIEVAVHHERHRLPHQGMAPLIGKLPQGLLGGLVQQRTGQAPGLRAGGIKGQGLIQLALVREGPGLQGRLTGGKGIRTRRNQTRTSAAPGPGGDPRRRVAHRRPRGEADTGCWRRRRSRHSTLER